MFDKYLKKEKGVAGLEILVSVIAMLFMVGIIVMTFTIAGSKLQAAINATGDTAAASLINNTYQSMASVPDWFPTFIVLTALVVLILLVVIIISAIKGAGIMS